MSDPQETPAPDSISTSLYDVNYSDPDSALVDRSTLDSAAVAQITDLMKSLSTLREAERTVAEASEKYMKLSAQDMRALHYLIVAEHRDELVTPGMIGSHLDISPASVTKLLNRLEKGGHITREVHPTDRRAFSIKITASTHMSAMQTVGRQQSKRFHSAARLTPRERDTVIRFLTDMAHDLSMDGVDWSE